MDTLAGLARRARHRWRVRTGRPTLSIVVPVYNVEQYLRECLDSILAQPYADFEVVLVDDGSTDSSGAIAREYAERSPRFRLLRQANAGLGAARNAGVAAARGRFLAFLDSDDALPADPYTPLLRALEASGSDFSVGVLKRDDGTRQYATRRMRENHREERRGVTLAEMPRILADVFAVNKVYRRSFWDAAGMSFPVGVRYEDQPALTRAFVSARSFDVVRETVYLWRIREDKTSITQRRHDIADLRDRIATKRDSLALLDPRHGVPPHVREVMLVDVLPVDMWEYFRSVPGCSQEYWATLRDGVRELWPEDGTPFERTLVPVQQRLMGWLVSQGRREELEQLIAFVDAHPGGLPVEERGDRVVCLLPGHERAGTDRPAAAYELAPHERGSRASRG